MKALLNIKRYFALTWCSLFLILFLSVYLFTSIDKIRADGDYFANDIPSQSDKLSNITEVTVDKEPKPEADTAFVIVCNQRIDAIETDQGIYVPFSSLIEQCGICEGELPKLGYSEKYDCLTYGERLFFADAIMLEGEIYLECEDAARLFRARYENGTIYALNPPSYSEVFYNTEDLAWLAAIIHAEARGEPFEGKLAVGAVVMNRVSSPLYPDTVKDVIFDKKHGVQFAPTADGSILLSPCEDSIAAAKLCLEGYRIKKDVLFFYNPDISESTYFKDHRSFEFRIGSHEFYS